MRNQKRLTLLILVAAMLLWITGALAEVHIHEKPPESWAERSDIVRVTQVDTNRSDCLLIEAFGKVMLIDGGYPGTVKHPMNLLRQKGITHFDWIVNTHPHDDHVDGTLKILRAGWTADVLYSPFAEKPMADEVRQAALLKLLKQLDIPYRQVPDGFRLLITPTANTEIMPGETAPQQTAGTTTVSGLLTPLQEPTLELTMYTLPYNDLNYASMLMTFRYGEATMLFTADLPITSEQDYVARFTNGELKSDIVKAPHHGIIRFDEGFLDAADPALVTIPNMSSRKTQIATQCRGRSIPYLYSGDGDIIMETDGIDWYVWTIPQSERKE